MTRKVFEHDQFLGARQTTWRKPEFSVSQLVPTVPEDGVIEHAHAEAHFVLVLEGDYVSCARGLAGANKVSSTRAGPILVYNPPGTLHRDRFRSQSGRFVTVSLSLAAQRGLEEVLILPDYAMAPGPAALQAALRLTCADDDSTLALESLCVELMTATATRYEQVMEQVPRWLLSARDCLHDDLESPAGLADIARACGVHPVHLARAFRRHFGCSPGAYRRRLRLNLAAAMLRGDSADMSEIAIRCGYFDQAHFSRAFREAFGVPPGGYRQQAWSAPRPAGSIRTRSPQISCAQ
ncbi:MAG: helix-turn-helix transcriptional regulator [Stenotrophomonas sp.]